MLILSAAALRKAEEFVGTHARPLEQALFATFVYNASTAWALEELAAFQNSDGGFGHGLEPDLQFPGSSVLATTVALQHLRELGADKDHPLVLGAMRYLMDTYDHDAQAWPFVPPAIVDAPRAPWWQHESDLTKYLVNPRVEVVGYLFDYPALVPEQMRESLLVAVMAHLENQPRRTEMHELLCYRRLVETTNLPEEARETLLKRLRPVIADAVETDPDEWRGYVLKPLQMAPTPTSPFAGQFQESIDLNLDFEISQQQDDGSWAPAWSWGDAYPDAWPHAKRAWQGVLTVGSVKSLVAFDRVEPHDA